MTMAPPAKKVVERPCWLVGTDPNTGKSQVVEARLVSPVSSYSPWKNGLQINAEYFVVRVGYGCGVLHTLHYTKVHPTREHAEKKLQALQEEHSDDSTC